MLLGLDTNSYRLATGLSEYQPARPLGLGEILARTKDLGLAGVHIANPRLLESTDPGYLASVRRAAEADGLYLELGAHGTDVQHLREAIEVAATLGAPILRTFVDADRKRGWAAWRQQLDRAIDGLKQVVPVAKQSGVRIALENHGDLTSAELVNLLDKVGSDQVGACLDTGKSLLVVEDPQVSAQNLVPYLVTACLTDYQMVPTAVGARIVGCALGEGVVALNSIVQLLRQRRPDLHLNVESPVQSWELPYLEDKFWDAFYDRGPKDLAAVLRLMRQHPPSPDVDYRPPLERGLTEEEVLRHEDQMLRRSIAYAKHLLLAT